MKCVKCNSEVSIADSKCPKCGHDLLQFGSTTFYGPSNRQSHAKGIKDMVYGGVSKGMGEQLRSLDKEEKIVLSPATERLANIFCRHVSAENFDEFFNKEVLPAVDDMEGTVDGKQAAQKAEENIRRNLGDAAYTHYRTKGKEVLRVLRAGEHAYMMIDGGTNNIDLSVKMFPYFKAAEVSCRKHSEERYKGLRGHPTVKAIDNWIGDRQENIYGKDIPRWIERKSGFLGVLNMLLGRKPDRNLFNCRGTGISLFVFGREGIEIRGEGFAINNIFAAKGDLADRTELSRILCELQDVRNDLIHEKVEDREAEARKARATAYRCLKAVPVIMEI